MIRKLLAVILLLLTASFVRASQWKVEDIINQETANHFKISPDCKWVVWEKSTADADKDKRVKNLMLSSLTEKKEIELTRGAENNYAPAWSPDSQRIAFISTRPIPVKKGQEQASEEDKEDPVEQLWIMPLSGGEPWNLTESRRSVLAMEWIDNDTILFAAQEDAGLYETAQKERKDTSIVVDDEPHAPPVRLFRGSVKEKQITRISDNEDRIFNFWISPDGTKAVALHHRSLHYEYDQKIPPVTFLYDLATGKRQQLFANEKIMPEDISWTPDSKAFYVTSQFSSDPVYLMATILVLHHYDLSSGKLTRVDLDWDRGLSYDGVEATVDGFLAQLADGARNKQARYTRRADGWDRDWIEGDHSANIFSVELGEDGKTLAYEYSTASLPIQWYHAKLESNKIRDAAQITDLNSGWKSKPISKSEVIHWKGAKDEDVEGILYYPQKYEAGKKYPLVLMIHGGPSAADFDYWDESWAYSPALMTQRGTFVLKPNYHGSTNYGLPFVESIAGGNYYDLEVQDMEKGVDALIAKGLVDPDQLGTMGWSNGSILTIALTANSTRYKVASAGAGDVEWSSDWGNCAFGASFDNYYFGTSPLENPEVYMKKSPFFRMKDVKTPTIIFFGTEDKNVPTEQGWMHYRALQQLGQTDVRFILFPGEPHSPEKLTHQTRKLVEEFAWFDKYLFHGPAPENEAVKKGSPLDVALKLKTYARSANKYGVVKNGILIPETVQNGEFEIGRFEVTRSQYAEFDHDYQVSAGKENYPANEISYEKAKAYCEWLSSKTGAKYRLGAEEETKDIYEKAKEGENTLDYWAGYSVNPDDAAALATLIANMGDGASLLRQAGSFRAVETDSEDFVFDLGGNVAEWITGADGKAKLAGAAANSPADPKTAQNPGAAYTGFRVVKE